MPTQRTSDEHGPEHRHLRRLAAGLVALLVLLISTALATDTAFAAPTAGTASPSPSAPPTSPQSPAAGTASPNQIAWSIQAATKNKPDTRPTLNYTDLPPGTSRQDSVAVHNFGAKSLKLTVYPSDAYNTRTGGFDVLPAAQHPVDVGSWIHMARTTVDVAPGGIAIVPFTIAVPKNATPGFHVGGIVASASGIALDAKGDTVRVDRRVGMRMFLQVSGPLHPALAVKGLTVHYQGGWDPIHAGTATITYTVANTGNVPLQAHQTLRTDGLFGVFGKSTHGADVPLLLPGNSVRVSAKVTGIWPGGRLHTSVQLAPYTTLVSLAMPPTSSSTSTWAVPWTWLIAVLVVLVTLGTWTRRRRRRRRARKATDVGERTTTETPSSAPRESEAHGAAARAPSGSN